MRCRYPSTSALRISFGPGPLTPAIKALVIANVVAFVLALLAPAITLSLGLRSAKTSSRGCACGSPSPTCSCTVGSSTFSSTCLRCGCSGSSWSECGEAGSSLKYYFVAGLGAAATQILLSFFPGDLGNQFYYSLTIGASGAVYGVLLAYAMYFPNRPIYMYLVFPIPAKYFVMIMGAISLLSSMSGAGGGIAHYDPPRRTGRGVPVSERSAVFVSRRRFSYRLTKWRINRMRRRFDVYSGGRANDINRRVH